MVGTNQLTSPIKTDLHTFIIAIVQIEHHKLPFDLKSAALYT